MKTIMTIAVLAGGASLWIAAQTPTTTGLQATASFVPTTAPTRSKGKVAIERGVGGFDRLTYVGNGFTVTRPVYPPGHVLNSAEQAEEQSFAWPANMTPADFDDMVAQRKDIYGKTNQ